MMDAAAAQKASGSMPVPGRASARVKSYSGFAIFSPANSTCSTMPESSRLHLGFIVKAIKQNAGMASSGSRPRPANDFVLSGHEDHGHCRSTADTTARQIGRAQV